MVPVQVEVERAPAGRRPQAVLEAVVAEAGRARHFLVGTVGPAVQVRPHARGVPRQAGRRCLHHEAVVDSRSGSGAGQVVAPRQVLELERRPSPQFAHFLEAVEFATVVAFDGLVAGAAFLVRGADVHAPVEGQRGAGHGRARQPGGAGDSGPQAGGSGRPGGGLRRQHRGVRGFGWGPVAPGASAPTVCRDRRRARNPLLADVFSTR
jgi:hypothetical protein